MVTDPLLQLRFPIQYLEIFEALARSRGLDEESFRAGSPWPDRGSPLPETMHGRHFLQLLEQAMSYGDPGRPLSAQLLEHAPITVHGTLGIVIMTSPNLEAALEAALQFYPLVMPACNIQRIAYPDSIHLLVNLTEDFAPFNETMVELVLGSFNGLRHDLRPDFEPLTLEVRHQARFPAETYASFADPERLYFGRRHNRMILPHRLLELPLHTSSRTTRTHFQRELEDQIAHLRQRLGLAAQVKEVLDFRLRHGEAVDLASVAAQLNRSSRSLTRHLGAEGVSFRQLLNECRIDHAAHLLRTTRKPISQVAYAAGYHNDSSFCRAFRARMNLSPQTYREES